MDSALSFLLFLAFTTVSIEGARFTIIIGNHSFETDEVYFYENSVVRILLGAGVTGNTLVVTLNKILNTGTEIKIQINRMSNSVTYTHNGFHTTHSIEHQIDNYYLEFEYSSVSPNLDDKKTASDEFMKALLNLLNYYRKIHRAGELKIDQTFKTEAQMYANNEIITTSIQGFQLFEMKCEHTNIAPRGSIAAAYVADFWYAGFLHYNFDLEENVEKEQWTGLATNSQSDCFNFVLTAWINRSEVGIGLKYAQHQGPNGMVETMRVVQRYIPNIIVWQHDALKQNVLKP